MIGRPLSRDTRICLWFASLGVVLMVAAVSRWPWLMPLGSSILAASAYGFRNCVRLARGLKEPSPELRSAVDGGAAAVGAFAAGFCGFQDRWFGTLIGLLWLGIGLRPFLEALLPKFDRFSALIPSNSRLLRAAVLLALAAADVFLLPRTAPPPWGFLLLGGGMVLGTGVLLWFLAVLTAAPGLVLLGAADAAYLGVVWKGMISPTFALCLGLWMVGLNLWAKLARPPASKRR